MAAATKTAQCELSASPAAKGASPSLPEMNKSTRAVQNEYTTPYKDDGDYGPLYCVPSFDEQKIYEEFEGKMFRKLQHDEIMLVQFKHLRN